MGAVYLELARRIFPERIIKVTEREPTTVFRRTIRGPRVHLGCDVRLAPVSTDHELGVDLEIPFSRPVAHAHCTAVPPPDLLHRASFAYVCSGVTRSFNEEHILLISRNAQAVIDTRERREPLANLEVAVVQREVLGLCWSQCQNLAECSHLLQFLNAIWDENMRGQRVGRKSRFVQDHYRSTGTGERDRGGGTGAASPDNDYVDGLDSHSAILVWNR